MVVKEMEPEIAEKTREWEMEMVLREVEMEEEQMEEELMPEEETEQERPSTTHPEVCARAGHGAEQEGGQALEGEAQGLHRGQQGRDPPQGVDAEMESAIVNANAQLEGPQVLEVPQGLEQRRVVHHDLYLAPSQDVPLGARLQGQNLRPKAKCQGEQGEELG